MQTIQWNTNRPYTELGQRIRAAMLANNVVVFHDYDRGISGELHNCRLLCRSAVMQRYDAGDYLPACGVVERLGTWN